MTKLAKKTDIAKYNCAKVIIFLKLSISRRLFMCKKGLSYQVLGISLIHRLVRRHSVCVPPKPYT